ncbi:transglycosylase SLT domain-containing protein [Methylococcus sp. EFPC2]|nr:transglycosylase SLT domain-containing protein [Methylococcus sp. EFPC2]
MAACSTKPVVHKTNGRSQATPPREPIAPSNPILAYPDDTPEPAYHPSEVFPRPREIEPQVKFWRKVYASWSRSQVAIHDKLHMNVIYEVVQLPDGVGESLTPEQKEYIQSRLDGWKRRLGDLEYKLASGAALNGDEQGLVEQVGQITGDRNAIYGASQRLRQQRGLRERFKKGLAIGSRYDRKYREIFRNAGLPEDLAYLPHVESSFQFNAHSSAGALGVWQFTAGAARIFMDGDDSAEARLDPIASTYGAARYLSHAYHKLGSWPLAVTSYNHGIGGMQRAKNRFGHDFPRIVKEYDHPQFGFASRNYYAEFLAAREIASEPQRFFPEGLNYEGDAIWTADASARKSAFSAASTVPQPVPATLKVASAATSAPVVPILAPKAAYPRQLAGAARVQPVSFKGVSTVRAEPKKAVLVEYSKSRPSVSPKAQALAGARRGETRPQLVPRQANAPKSAAKNQARAVPVGYGEERRPVPATKYPPKSR